MRRLTLILALLLAAGVTFAQNAASASASASAGRGDSVASSECGLSGRVQRPADAKADANPTASGDFSKPKFEVSVADSITKFSLSEDYSVQKASYTSLYEFSKYDALKPTKLDINKIPSFYARLGAQYPLMPLLDLDFRKMVNENLVFGFNGHHDSYFVSKQNRMDNNVGGDIKYVWSRGEFSLGVLYDNRYLLFKDDSGNRAEHSLGDLNFYARICSANEKINDIFYDFKCSLDSRNNKLSAFYEAETLGLKETDFIFKGYVGTTFDIHRIYVDMDIKTTGYGGLKNYSTSIVQFSPLYEFKTKRFYGKVGVIFGNRFGVTDSGSVRAEDGNLLEAVSSIFPNVDARVEIARRVLWAHLTVDGGYDLNNFAQLSGFCPVVNPGTALMVGEHPVDARLSLESVLSGRFSMNVSARYRMDKNLPYVAPVIGNSDVHSMLACSMDVNTLTAGAEMLWKSSALAAGGEFHYNTYFSTDFEKVTQLPAITSRAFVRYNWRQRLVISVECSYASAISGHEYGVYEIPEKIDLSAEVDFALSRHVKIFVKGGNLLNRSIQYMPTYEEPGINVGGGLALTF